MVLPPKVFNPGLMFSSRGEHQSGKSCNLSRLKRPARDKHSSLFCLFISGIEKCFKTLTAGVDLIKLFSHKFTLFCKLHLMITMQQILLMFINDLAYKVSVNLLQNSFMRSTQGSQCYTTFFFANDCCAIS